MTKKQKQMLIKAVLTVVCLIILAVLWFVVKPMFWDKHEVPDGTVELHFIDVGQGDATLIRVGDANILVDTGDKGAKDDLLNYLDEQKVEKIKYFVITHFDADHFANAVDVLEKYDVETLIIPKQEKTTKMFETFVDKAAEQEKDGKIEIKYANDMIEEKLTVNDLEITVLAPLKEKYKDSNDHSIVLMLRYGNRKVLLTGDAESEAEEDIVEKYGTGVLDCDVYKMGHHGSSTSSSQELLNKTTPDYVLISCGEGNDYGHPHKEALDRVKDSTCYRTDKQGTIVLSITNDEMTFKTEK